MPDGLAEWMPLFQTVGVGGVLWFVLIRLEAAMHETTRAVDRLSMQIALLLDRSPRSSEGVELLVKDAAKRE